MATIEQGATLEEVLEPSYWSHVAAKMHMLDKVECWWQDGSRWVELLVVKASGSDARCRVIVDLDLRASGATIDLAKELSGFEISYGGPSIGHRIVRKSDLVVIHSDSRWSEDDARRWLLNYLSQPNRRDVPIPAPRQAEVKPLHGAAAAAKAKAEEKKKAPRPPPGAPIPGSEAA